MKLKQLLEMSRVEDKDWKFNNPILGKKISEEIVLQLQFVSNLKDEISLFLEPNFSKRLRFVLVDQEKMLVVGIMELEQTNLKVEHCSKIFVVDEIEILKEYRKQGLAEKTYDLVMRKIGCLMTDEVLYKGAVHLWKKMIKSHQVIGFDLKTKQIIETGDFEELFGKGIEKKDIRLILRESSVIFGD